MTPKKPRAKPGPKPTGKGEPILVRMLPELLEPLDRWADEQGEEISRPEAIRRIVTDHLGRRGYLKKP